MATATPTATPTVILLRGAPGVGKSTLAHALRDRLERGAIVEVDRLRSMVIGCDWTEHHTHRAAIMTAVEFARQLERGPVVIVDTFAGLLSETEVELERAGLRHVLVSLWLAPAKLAERVETRVDGYRNVSGALAVNAAILNEPRFDAFETLIDATGLDVEALLARTLHELERRGCKL